MAETVSSKPWSDFSPGDYTDDQWLKACLLDRGTGSGSAKQRASLPVREPNGTLNKNACHAAASALAGGRGGVKASPELLASAKKKLAALYMSALGADVPDSLKHDNVTFEEILATHGDVTLEHARAKEDQNKGPDAAWLMKENIANLKQRAANMALKPGIVAEVTMLAAKYKVPKNHLAQSGAAMEELTQWYIAHLNATLAQIGISPSRIYRLVAKRGSGFNIYASIEGGDASKRYSLPEEPVLTHDDELTEFLEHFGVLGMKWGRRQSDAGTDSGGLGSLMSKEEIKAHNAVTDQMSKTIKNAHNEAQIEHLLDNAHLNGRMEGNIKVSGIGVSPDGKKIDYEIKLYRFTPGKPNNSSADGIKVEYVNKTVDRLKPGHGWSHADEKKAQESPDYAAAAKQIALKSLGHQEAVDDFLEHHGIKGQKWGIRRTDAQLGTVARLKNKFSRKKGESDDAEEPKGKASGSDSKPEGGGPKSGGGSDHVAVDHERLVDSLNKSVSEMSTQEIQQASNRAQAIQNYQRLFSPENNAKSPLEQHVAQLNLEKQRRDLEAQLNPPQKSAMSKLVERSQQGFTAYQAIDKAVGGDLSKALSRKLGINPPPNELDQAKLRTEIAKSHKAEAEARAAIANSAKKVQADDILRIEEHALKGVLLSGHVDAASKAPNYPIIGKRSLTGAIPGAGGGTHKLGLPDRSLDADHWTTKGYRITNGVFQSNPSYKPAAKIPSLTDLTSTLHSAPAAPRHRKDNPLDALLLNIGKNKAPSGKIPTSFPKRGKHR